MSVRSRLEIEDLGAVLECALRLRASEGQQTGLVQSFLQQFLAAAEFTGIRLTTVSGDQIQTLFIAGGATLGWISDADLMHFASATFSPLSTSRIRLQTDGCIVATAQVSDQIAVVLEVTAEYISQEFCDATADLCADLRRRELVNSLTSAAGRREALDQLLALLHTHADELQISSVLATDAASVLGCLRVSVCRRQGPSSWQLLAATSVSGPNDRADAVREICAAVANAADTIPDDLVARSAIGSPTLRQVLPLSKDRQWSTCIRAVVLDWDKPTPQNSAAVAAVCQHAAIAYAKADQRRSASLLSRFKICGIRYRRPLLLLTIAGLVSGLMPLQLRLEVPGVFEPAHRTHFYAPESSIVTAVHVADGDDVVIGDQLLELRSDELSLQLEEVLGDLATSQARLSALESLRLNGQGSRNSESLSEQKEVQSRIQSLEQQRQLLSSRMDTLPVTAASDGRLFGPDLRERFLGRPVARGQYLFEIADTKQPWRLRLQLPELEVRHLLQAMADGAEPPQVHYFLSTSPDRLRQARVTELGQTTELDDLGNLTTTVYAYPEHVDESEMARSGTGVIAWIDCGRRAAGYVCFRKLIDLVRRQMLL